MSNSRANGPERHVVRRAAVPAARDSHRLEHGGHGSPASQRRPRATLLRHATSLDGSDFSGTDAENLAAQLQVTLVPSSAGARAQLGVDRVAHMDCHVINLSSQPSRWTEMVQRCRSVELRPLRHEAALGSALPTDLIARYYSKSLNAQQYHRPLTLGEIGCYVSHLQLWQGFLDSGQACCAVLEDDVELAEDFTEVLAAVSSIRASWDMIKLIGRDNELASASLPLTGRRNVIRYRRVPSYTSAYIISREGAKKLLEGRLPFGRPIDLDLRHWWELGLRILGVHPYPVRLSSSSLLSGTQPPRRALGPRDRLRKLHFQLGYSFRNWIEEAFPRP